MLNGIVHCFLGDVVKMRRDGIVVNQDRGFALECALQHRRCLLPRRPRIARPTSSPARPTSREAGRAPAHASCEPLHSPGARSWPHQRHQRHWFSANFSSCTLAMKAMPVRCWPSPSCRVLPDAALLPGADVQQRPLQLLALRDIDSGGNDVVGAPVVVGQESIGPGDEPARTVPGHPMALIILRQQVGAQLRNHRAGAERPPPVGEKTPRCICRGPRRTSSRW